MLILNEKEMWEAVTLEDNMEAIEQAYEIHRLGTYKMPDRMIAQRDQNMIMYMPCFIDDYVGTKMLSEFPDNPKKGLPYLSGLMIVNDAETGLPAAIMNGSAITAMRTGAAGGLAIRNLSREDCSSVGLVGCGVQGLNQLVYACHVRPIRRICLYDAYVKDLTPFMERLQKRLGDVSVEIRVCENVRTLCENSDILISCTQATYPVYPDDMELLRGKCIIAIGSWRPERRELPDAVWRLVDQVYTEMPYALEETGDLRIPLATGVLTNDRVCYMEDLLYDKKRGVQPKMSATTCFKSVGMGLYDICTARMIYERAKQKGIGQEIPW